MKTSSYISAFSPWFFAVLAVLLIEGGFYAWKSPSMQARTNFKPYAVQEQFVLEPQRYVMATKLLELDVSNATVLVTGDSSGLHGIIPDVVDRYLDGGHIVNLNCCGNLGWHGYIGALEVALQKAPKAKAIVIHSAAVGFPQPTHWRQGPRLTGQIPLFTMGEPIEREFLSIKRFASLPTMALRRDLIQNIFFLGRIEPREVFADMANQFNYTIKRRDGYVPQSDPATTMVVPACGSVVPTFFDWRALRERSVFDAAMNEFVDLAAKYQVVPIMYWPPSPCIATEKNAAAAYKVIAEVQRDYPTLHVPLGFVETLPENYFGVPAHMQRNIAMDNSKRLGRAIRAATLGEDVSRFIVTQDSIEAISVAPEAAISVISARQVTICSGDVRSVDMSSRFAKACDGKGVCTVPGVSPDNKPAGCSAATTFVELRCGAGAIRQVKQDVNKLYPDMSLDCRQFAIWDQDKTPRGFTLVEATYGGNCKAGKQGNASMVTSGECDGSLSCIVDPPAYPMKFEAACKPDFSLSWRCGTELETRTKTVSGSEQRAAFPMTLSCPASSG